MRPRRELIVVSICGVILAGMGCADRREHNNAPAVLLRKSEAAGVNLAKPTPAQAAWQDMEIGMFIHFGIETWQDKETDDEPVMENLELFNPTDIDTDQWVSVAESIGAKYIILVAKHHGGFCLWQTDTTEYSIKNSPYKDGKGDIVADLADSCRKRGMKLGIYISPADFSQKTAGGGKSNDAEIQKKYSNIYRQQWTELLTRYGEIMEIWFDGSTVVKMDDIIQRYAPDAMVFQSPWATIRWVGNEGAMHRIQPGTLLKKQMLFRESPLPATVTRMGTPGCPMSVIPRFATLGFGTRMAPILSKALIS